MALTSLTTAQINALYAAGARSASVTLRPEGAYWDIWAPDVDVNDGKSLEALVNAATNPENKTLGVDATPGQVGVRIKTVPAANAIFTFKLTKG